MEAFCWWGFYFLFYFLTVGTERVSCATILSGKRSTEQWRCGRTEEKKRKREEKKNSAAVYISGTRASERMSERVCAVWCGSASFFSLLCSSRLASTCFSLTSDDRSRNLAELRLRHGSPSAGPLSSFTHFSDARLPGCAVFFLRLTLSLSLSELSRPRRRRALAKIGDVVDVVALLSKCSAFSPPADARSLRHSATEQPARRRIAYSRRQGAAMLERMRCF